MLNTRRRTLCSHTHWYQRLCMQIFRWRLSVSSFLKMKAPHTSFSTITTFHDQLMGRKECTRYSSFKTHKSLPFSKYMSFNAPPYDFFFIILCLNQEAMSYVSHPLSLRWWLYRQGGVCPRASLAASRHHHQQPLSLKGQTVPHISVL